MTSARKEFQRRLMNNAWKICKTSKYDNVLFDECLKIAWSVTKSVPSFEQIHRDYYRPLFGYVLQKTQCEDTTKDILQDVFLKIFENLNDFIPQFDDVEKSVKSWCFRIATNKVIDFYRNHKRKNIQEDVYDIENNISLGLEPNQHSNLIKDHLHHHMNNLSEAKRTLLQLHYIDGYKCHEIADMVGKPLNTVLTHIRRAKMELKTKMIATM